MRILICEDSEQNLASAREFAESVRGEHEVTVVGEYPRRALRDIQEGEYDLVLTDVNMPAKPGAEPSPTGMFVAMAALQMNIPVGLVTDGDVHGGDPIVKSLANCFLEQGNGRLRVWLISEDGSKSNPNSAWYCPFKEPRRPGQPMIKDWEYCFRSLLQSAAQV